MTHHGHGQVRVVGSRQGFQTQHDDPPSETRKWGPSCAETELRAASPGPEVVVGVKGRLTTKANHNTHVLDHPEITAEHEATPKHMLATCEPLSPVPALEAPNETSGIPTDTRLHVQPHSPATTQRSPSPLCPDQPPQPPHRQPSKLRRELWADASDGDISTNDEGLSTTPNHRTSTPPQTTQQDTDPFGDLLAIFGPLDAPTQTHTSQLGFLAPWDPTWDITMHTTTTIDKNTTQHCMTGLIPLTARTTDDSGCSKDFSTTPNLHCDSNTATDSVHPSYTTVETTTLATQDPTPQTHTRNVVQHCVSGLITSTTRTTEHSACSKESSTTPDLHCQLQTATDSLRHSYTTVETTMLCAVCVALREACIFNTTLPLPTFDVAHDERLSSHTRQIIEEMVTDFNETITKYKTQSRHIPNLPDPNDVANTLIDNTMDELGETDPFDHNTMMRLLLPAVEHPAFDTLVKTCRGHMPIRPWTDQVRAYISATAKTTTKKELRRAVADTIPVAMACVVAAILDVSDTESESDVASFDSQLDNPDYTEEIGATEDQE